MAWVALFPTSNTNISDSVTQIQTNWAFLQTNISTDHFFDTGAPTDGHHKHFITQNQATPALTLDAVVYSKATAGYNVTELGVVTAQASKYISTIFKGQTVIGGAGTNTIVNFTGLENTMGMIYISGSVLSGSASAFYIWDGTNLIVNQYSAAGVISSVSASGANLQITTTGAVIAVWYYQRNSWLS